MNRPSVSPLAAVSLGLLATCSATAQTFNEPTFFVWGEYPGEPRAQHTYPFSHPWMKKTVQPNLLFSLAERANTSEQDHDRAVINAKVISRLKVQMVYDAEPVLGFTSKTDLVQLAFYPEVNIESGTSAIEGRGLAGPSFSVADLNMDGVVNEWDTAQFLEEYELAQPAANLNEDDAVDDADVDVFVEALING